MKTRRRMIPTMMMICVVVVDANTVIGGGNSGYIVVVARRRCVYLVLALRMLLLRTVPRNRIPGGVEATRSVHPEYRWLMTHLGVYSWTAASLYCSIIELRSVFFFLLLSYSQPSTLGSNPAVSLRCHSPTVTIKHRK